MKVLVYLRKEPMKSFYTNLAAFISDNNFNSVSEFKSIGDVWLGKYLYQNAGSNFFNNIDANDIYLRCRFLRKIEFKEAQILINRMTYGILSTIEKYNPSIVLAPLIDNYTLDILERVARIKKIPYISIVGHFFNGYSRISTRGEYNYFPRIVTNEEVESVYNTLTKNDYIPIFHRNIKSGYRDKQFFWYKQLFKKHIYFPFMKFIQMDTSNYHYNTTIGKSNNLDNWTLEKNSDNYFTKIDDIAFSTNNIYFPLHFTPEATVDYWCDDPNYGANYTENVLNIIKSSSNNFQFIVKEHPAIYMMRNSKFYEKLLSHSNVKIIHPYENSNLLLNKVNYVFTENGSVGVEALIRNKIVLTNSKSYYSKFHPNIHKMSIINNDLFTVNVEKYDNKQFVKDILQGNIFGRLINNKNILHSDIDLLSPQIKKYCNIKSM